MKGQCATADACRADVVVPATAHGFNLWRRLARWYEVGRQRRALAALDDDALKDLGLSRADIYQESERPFWDDPLKK